MGGWASKASRLCWSLHPKGSTDFATRVQWRACASHTGGGGYVFTENLTPGIWKWIPFGKGKTSTRNHQLLGFQLSIFVGVLISGMWDSGLNQWWLFLGGGKGRFFGIGWLLSWKCDVRLEFQKRIWPKLHCQLVSRFFVGGRGIEFCSPFPNSLRVRKPEKKNQVKKAPRCQLPCFRWQLGWWVDGWLVPGISKNAWKSGLLVLKPSEIRRSLMTSWGCRIFFCINSYGLVRRIRVVKDVFFDKQSLLYYFWKLRLWGKVDESEREILSDGWLQVEGRILLLNTW